MEKRHGTLRFVANAYKFVGILLFGFTILSSVGALGISILGGGALASELGAGGGSLALIGIFYSVVGFIYGSLLSLGIYMIGAAIMVFLDIEENTRLTSLLLNRLSKQLK